MSWSSAGPQRRSPRAMRLASGQPLAATTESRTCKAPGCATHLSRYNADLTCARHGGWKDAEEPRRRPRPARSARTAAAGSTGLAEV